MLRDILWGVWQDAEFHPEGDVWTHTRAVRASLDEGIALLGSSALAQWFDGNTLVMSKRERAVQRVAAWCHDLGKAGATQLRDGRWRSPGHERPVYLNPALRQLGAPWTKMWANASFEDRKTFVYLVTRHMAICDACGPERRIVRALRSPHAALRRRAELLIVLMMMDRLGSGRASRIEDAMIVPATFEIALRGGAQTSCGKANCWTSAGR